MDRHRHALGLILSALIVVGCGATGRTDAPASSASATGPSAAIASAPTPATVSPRPTPRSRPTPLPRPTIPAGSLSLVGLGDSVPGALGCDQPCRSYVEVYGELASTALGKPVVVENLATNDGLTSRSLRFRIEGDDAHRAAIAAADLITITIGANDFQGPCDAGNMVNCLAAGTADVKTNLAAILDEIAALRHGKPTAIRVTTYYDWYVGDPNTPSIWGLPQTDENATLLHAKYEKALTAFDAMICAEAERHGVGCVDLLPVFNGPDDETDAGALLGGDHLHPAKAGHDLIAKTIAASGFAPLD